MDEYISKKEVLDYLNGYLHLLDDGGADTLLFDRGQRRALINSIQDILAVKAADVQSVKHSYWITSHPVDVAKEFKCIVCGGLIELPVFTKHCYYNYCPNCGARMDGDAE